MDKLASFLERQIQKKGRPHSLPDIGQRSISSGALPSEASGPEFIARWTMIAVGAIILFEAVMFVIASAIARADPQAHDPNYLHVAWVAIGLPLVGGIIAFLAASRESNRRQQHVLALAEAARQTGLHFLPLVPLPETMTEAFPVICPTPPVYGWHVAAERARVTLFGTGAIHGHPLHLAQFEFHFDQNDHTPLGGVAKAFQTLVKPTTALSRPEIWQMYLLAIFPEVLAHTSDFLITPANRDFAATYIERQFGQYFVPLPDYGELCKYTLASPSRDDSRSLPGSDVLNLLAAEEGWSIQLVAGRLMIWRGVYYPAFQFWSSISQDTVTELVHFAAKARQMLAKCDAARE